MFKMLRINALELFRFVHFHINPAWVLNLELKIHLLSYLNTLGFVLILDIAMQQNLPGKIER